MDIGDKDNNFLTFHGSNFLKQRVILSLLSGKSIQIVDIRKDDDEPGLKGFEVSLIRLLDKISNGTEIEINKSGTSIYFKPGLLNGGTLTHDCNLGRGIGEYTLTALFQFECNQQFIVNICIFRLLFGCIIGSWTIL